MQEHPEPQKKRKELGTLKESMLKGSPFPKLHAKAAEVKSMLQPVSSAMQHFRDIGPSKQTVLDLIVKVLDASSSIDQVVDQIVGFKASPAQGRRLEELVLDMNVGITKLCHHFVQQGLFLFNFVPKNHYLFHLADSAKHLSPRLAWCYQGEDLMNKVKVLAQGSFRGTAPKILGNKVLGKYLVGLSQALSD